MGYAESEGCLAWNAATLRAEQQLAAASFLAHALDAADALIAHSLWLGYELEILLTGTCSFDNSMTAYCACGDLQRQHNGSARLGRPCSRYYLSRLAHSCEHAARGFTLSLQPRQTSSLPHSQSSYPRRMLLTGTQPAARSTCYGYAQHLAPHAARGCAIGRQPLHAAADFTDRAVCCSWVRQFWWGCRKLTPRDSTPSARAVRVKSTDVSTSGPCEKPSSSALAAPPTDSSSAPKAHVLAAPRVADFPLLPCSAQAWRRTSCKSWHLLCKAGKAHHMRPMQSSPCLSWQAFKDLRPVRGAVRSWWLQLPPICGGVL